MLGLLVLVLELAAEDRACYGSNNAVAAHLVTAEVASCTATQSTHKASVAFSLHVGVCGAVLSLLRLAVSILALRVLVLSVCALLRELLRWGLARVLALWRVLLLLAVSVAIST